MLCQGILDGGYTGFLSVLANKIGSMTLFSIGMLSKDVIYFAFYQYYFPIHLKCKFYPDLILKSWLFSSAQVSPGAM